MGHESDERRPLTRRELVQRGAVVTAAALLAACGVDSAQQEGTPAGAIAQNQVTRGTRPGTATSEAGSAPALQPTPQCADDDDETPAQTEGPFYTPDTPERSSFLEDGSGTTMLLAGRVLTTDCQPIAGALLDFWHADDAGEYDNAGFRFRGYQFTDTSGSYRLETVVPGLYPGRTRHFHVKVQGPNTALLTTQLYFPGEPRNEQDGIFHPALLMEVREAAEGVAGAFDFVLA